jgi:hypothetical protein
MPTIAIDKKEQDEQEYPDATRQVPLVQEDDLRPNAPEFAAVRVTGRKKVFKIEDGIERGGNRWLRAEERDEAERSMKVKERRANAAHRPRIEKELSQRHDEGQHADLGQDA